jgi:hypothetical protein
MDTSFAALVTITPELAVQIEAVIAALTAANRPAPQIIEKDEAFARL